MPAEDTWHVAKGTRTPGAGTARIAAAEATRIAVAIPSRCLERRVDVAAGTIGVTTAWPTGAAAIRA